MIWRQCFLDTWDEDLPSPVFVFFETEVVVFMKRYCIVINERLTIYLNIEDRQTQYKKNKLNKREIVTSTYYDSVSKT